MVMLSGSLLFLNVQDWTWKITGQIVPSRRSTKSPTLSYSCYIQVNLFHQPLRSWRKVRILTQLVRLPIPSCGSPINAASIWQLESFANLAMQVSEGGLIALYQSININNRFDRLWSKPLLRSGVRPVRQFLQVDAHGSCQNLWFRLWESKPQAFRTDQKPSQTPHTMLITFDYLHSLLFWLFLINMLDSFWFIFMAGKIMAEQRQGKLRFGELILKWTAYACNSNSQKA